MLARAAIVLLVVLNVGVAAWWIGGGSAPAVTPPAPLDGPARLRLLSEVPVARRPVPSAPNSAATAAPADPAAAAADAATAPPGDAAQQALADKDVAAKVAADKAAALAAAAGGLPTDARCVALGPFTDDAIADAARERLRPQVLQLRDRRVVPASTRGWRVWLPPLADRDAAQAMAARITAAGFTDLFVLNSGDDANGIALGRFGSEPSARLRETALRSAGFTDVRAAALDAPTPQRWIDVAAAAGVGTATLRGVAGADRAPAIDCATLR